MALGQPSSSHYYLTKDDKDNVNSVINSLSKLQLVQRIEDLLTDDEDEINDNVTDDEEEESFITSYRDSSFSDLSSVLYFSSLHNSAYEDLSLVLLKEKCNQLDLSLTILDANVIEKTTRDQANSPLWHKLRQGRITASIFKSVCCTNPDKPSISLLTKICYPEKSAFTSKYTEWGRKNEKRALDEFITKMKTNHTNFTNVNSGLIILPKYPYFGASPDGLCSCDCCGDGCIEIKCPYTLKDGEPVDILTNRSNPFLIRNGGKFEINKKHAYYFQIQMQLFLTKRNYCHFVVWSPKYMLQIKILQDEQFWLKYSLIAETFFKNVVFPEILGKYFTRSVVTTSKDVELQMINKQ